ncbi:MAG: RNA methyltransferase [Candidatus Poseidoniia archaeon]|nr:RNA methyltransferase [Candidatus Poseidoniia archaeon]
MATIVLVEPQHPGNVGAVARVMANFGCDELLLVGGCEIDDDAMARAKAGQPLLESARRIASLKEALVETPVSVATSGIVPKGDSRWQRAPHPVQELADLLKGREPALVFGRENHGLDRGELALCDLTIQVPTSPEHPVLNLSHAVGIVLYELFRNDAFQRPYRPDVVERQEIDLLVERIMEAVRMSRFAKRRLPRAETTLRRVLVRGEIDEWDYETLMGMFKELRPPVAGK